MPLSDADIFKSEIYKTLITDHEKSNFVKKWKDLIEITELGGFSLNDIFRYYTHIERAKRKITDKEIGLRRFYTAVDKNNNKILSFSLVDKLIDLAKFWQDILLNSNDNIFLDIDGAKWLQCLKLYPNEFWRYIVSVYYAANKKDFNSSKFTLFLKELLAFLYAKFLISPTSSAIKTDIYKACVEIYHNNFKSFNQLVPEKIHFKNNSSGKLTKGILLLYAYMYSDKQELLPDNIEVEHICPKKWQNTNYNGWSYENAQKYLEALGNKIVLEKKLNIQCGNNYFGKKKEKYAESIVIEAKEFLANYQDNMDWNEESIILREQKMIEKLQYFFESYQKKQK
ncbi:HNH endonuclease family protein [Commensalibacter oyaizuii]|uniref:HNH endonuclease family protein n=1 Tax=Commensalibacter oyaizuii TaxID=3043873 RepID=A0ABT6PZR4_9PROT|nr:HNH endonuclease family protein [Commensalibacter sp. TBRC 16381]MDI2090352.1 HNH endonuclease family protein [Commensalibacter sp. TBRC 16381]